MLRRIVFVAAAVVPLLPAQLSPRFDLQKAHGIARDDAGLPWALGDRYKAAFRDGEVEYVPALGTKVARNLPVRFRLLDIARGDSQLSLPAPVLDVQDYLATFARGSVLERYESRADGLELSFVFRERPQGSGDLCVRLLVTTELTPTRNADGTLCFRHGDQGCVSIGAVTGVDAAGRMVSGSMAMDGQVLELRLPSAFVDEAALPLILDPLIGTGLLAGTATNDDSDVDAAFEASASVWLVAWRRSFSLTDQDIRAQLISATGTLIGIAVPITTANTPEIAPSVAAVRSRNHFVVAWQHAAGPLGPWDVSCRTVNAQTGATGATIAIGASAGDDVRPALSGDRSMTGDQALVVWNRSGNVLTLPVQVSATGVLTAGATQQLSGSGSSVGPFVSKSRVPGGIALVTTELTVFFNIVSATAVTYLGAPTGASVQIAGGDFRYGHGMDGNGTQFLVVRGGIGVFAQSVTWNGSALVLGTTATHGTDQVQLPAVGFLGERYLVAWHQQTANPFDDEVRGLALKPDCAACSEQFTVATVARANQRAPSVAPRYAGGDSTAEALLTWDETDTLPPFQGSVVGQRFAAMVGNPMLLIGPGCGAGGTASSEGPFALGNDSFRFTLTGADANAPIAVLSMGLGQPAIVCGSCQFTAPLVTHFVLPAGGRAAFPFALSCNAQFLGLPIEFQWLLFGAVGTPCPNAPSLAASNRMRVVFAP